MRCRYYYVGCHDMIEGAKYAQHMEDFHDEHLKLLESTVALQSQRISHLEATLSETQAKDEDPPELGASAPALLAGDIFRGMPHATQVEVNENHDVLPFPPVWEHLNPVNKLAGEVASHASNLLSSLLDLMTEPKEANTDDTFGTFRTWQILYLFVLSFVVLCYLLLAGMGRLCALGQLLPLLAYLALMVAHWRFALLFSAVANNLIAMCMQCVWIGLNLFLPVF